MNVLEYLNSSSDYLQYIKRFSDLGCIIGTLFIFCISFILKLIYDKLTLKNFKNKYSNEEILYVYKGPFCFVFLFAIIFGGGIGGFVLPFLFLEGSFRIRLTTSDNYIYFALLIILISYFVFLSGMTNIIIFTNKRIISENIFKTFIFPKWEVLLKDIENIVLLPSNKLKIYTKNNNIYGTGSNSLNKECCEKIKSLISEEKNIKGDE